MSDTTRRSVLLGAAGVAAASVTGCSKQTSSSPTPTGAASAGPTIALGSAGSGIMQVTNGWVAATEPGSASASANSAPPSSASGSGATQPSKSPSAAAPSPAPGTRLISSAYGHIINGGDKPDALVSVLSPIAGECQLHVTGSKDAGSMKQVNSIDVPATGTAILAVGGFHVMLLDVKTELKEGDQVPLIWTFRSKIVVETSFPVISKAHRPPP